VFLLIFLVSIAFWAFIRAIYTFPEAFQDHNFLVAESLFDEMVQQELVNCNSNVQRERTKEIRQFADTEELLIRILQHSKNFNSKISKIRSMIDGYRRPSDENMPV
jgi:hypothetical protein